MWWGMLTYHSMAYHCRAQASLSNSAASTQLEQCRIEYKVQVHMECSNMYG